MEIRWLNDYSKEFLERDYVLPGQTVEQRIDEIGQAAEDILKIEGFGKKVSDYIKKGWISPSTPIWVNFGNDRGLPISCFSTYCTDSVAGILGNVAEVGTMSKYGGGTAVYMGEIRPRGAEIKGNGVSNGSKSFLELFQATTNTISQGGTRRGYIAAYQEITHPDIEEWLGIRAEGDPIQQITWGVCVPTWWIEEMRNGDKSKQKIWAKVIQKRFETGMPYIFFNDNANNGESTPEVYKGKGLIKASNLCNEIFLQSSEDQSFVCNLSSLNDLYFDEWKDTDCVEVITFFLDAVMTEFIEKAKKIKFMDRAVNFAEKQRALGIGRLGYHSLLQSKMIPAESLVARNMNILIQKTIFEKSYEASKKLAEMFGEPEMLKGVGRRNVTLIALPPTTSTAFILGQVSQSIEFLKSNYMIKDLAKGKFVIKNYYLEKLLESKGQNTDEVWNSIKINHGSVLHLDFLTDEEKLVFKTANEIDQNEIIVQAAQRQKFIDQGQSLNLFVDTFKTAKDVNALMLKAHDMGIKGLYYQHNVSAAAILAKQLNCASCEG